MLKYSVIIFYLAVAALSFFGLLLYFNIAQTFKIIDKPNHRSSHNSPTVRGGGIVFIFAILLWYIGNNFPYPFFVVGFGLIGVISLIDDISEQSPLLRFIIQLISVLLLVWQVTLFQQSVWILALVVILSIGAINAFNFMDGINGITGIYALVNFISFYWLNEQVISFTDSSLIIVMGIAVLVFLFFNFRKNARCFAGDVGSVTLAFVQIFFCLQLIYATGNYSWILLFLVYGVDSVATIFYRLKKRENIFKPHRSHLYQYLANEMSVPHRIISVVYGVIQLVINISLIWFMNEISEWFYLVIIVLTGFTYVIIREKVLSRIGITGFFKKS
jgi:UDP-N-acetylmuramyl pentapeptide phosphotransferase/UDP-N-acetylglucosamine-1-phosphate transferase